MASLNRVMIIGYLGKDVELRQTDYGAFASFSVATDESYTSRNGEKISRSEWHRITASGKTAELCNQYLHKGSLVYIEGSLYTRKWNDTSGIDRYSTEIRVMRVQFLDRKGDNNNGNSVPQADSFDKALAGAGPGENMDDVLPF